MAAPQFWIIKNISDNSLTWSNMWGWIELEEDDETEIAIFSPEEAITFTLPDGGEWVAI